jgi:hypothetical protein
MIEAKVVETEKVLNGLIRALQDTFIAFGLQHKHLDSNVLQPFQFPIDFQAGIN